MKPVSLGFQAELAEKGWKSASENGILCFWCSTRDLAL